MSPSSFSEASVLFSIVVGTKCLESQGAQSAQEELSLKIHSQLENRSQYRMQSIKLKYFSKDEIQYFGDLRSGAFAGQFVWLFLFLDK